MDARAAIAGYGGLATTKELKEAGIGRAALVAALESGSVIRARQGWYAARDVDPARLAAARVGGRVTCLTALRLADVWVPSHTDLHVAVPPNAARLRSPRHSRERLDGGAIAHWSDDRLGSRLGVSLEHALLDALACVDTELVAASADSAFRRSPDLRSGWARVLAAAPARATPALQLVDGVCESGTETLFWQRLGGVRDITRRQVVISGIGRVDFLIGERLVVEIDSAAFHSSSNDIERDRARDTALSSLGYRVLRFSYWQIMTRWEEVHAALLAALARADHL